MEWQLYEPGTIPECATAEWYAGRDRAPHVDEALHRPRLELAARLINELVNAEAVDTVVDLGAGDGGLLWLVDHLADDAGVDCYGYDLQPSNIAGAAERGVEVLLADVTDLREVLVADDAAAVAVCTEFLEHLLDPHRFLRELAGRGLRYIVASSPRNERPGHAYEFHLWAWDEAGYAELLNRNGWHVLEQHAVGMFSVVLAEVAR